MTATRKSLDFFTLPLALGFAALAFAVRMPFLLSHRIAFDSDEAVEGLMARHVLGGELPAFFWGQAFKGVPEVYASAGAFAIFGSGATVLKSVTLGFFAIYVALNFILLDKLAGRWIAAPASLFLIVCPPALVFWSLDASAEYVLLMLLGTILLLLGLQWQRERAERTEERATFLPAAIGLVIGLGLWVQQLFVIYLVPMAIVLVTRTGDGNRRERGRLCAVPMALAAIAGLYVALAVVAFVTGGFSLPLGPYAVGAREPQKMLRIAIGIGALAVTLQFWQRTPPAAFRRFLIRAGPFGAGFLTGFSPALLYTVFVEPAHSPLRNSNLRQLIAAWPDIFGNVFPILSGFKIATTERLPIPLLAGIPAVLALLAYVWVNRHRLTNEFFPLFVICVPFVFFVSGAYLDTQSYRYLVPWYAGLCVAWAGGSLAIGTFAAAQFKLHHTGARLIAATVLGMILTAHAWQQILWYRGLRPDTESTAALDCLRRTGVRGGYADYWISYKLTFLSHEEIIIAPTNGVDRYPRYTDFVRSLPAQARIDDAARCR